MKIISLTENTTTCQLQVEHGLSLYIESDGKKILFDTGQSGLFADNSQRLRVNLAEIDFAVISHGHYDHAGGLKRFLEINKNAPVYISRHAFEPHLNTTGKDIGLDPQLSTENRLIFTDGEMKVSEHISLYSCNEKPRPFENTSPGMRTIVNGDLEPDDFRHEQYLIIEETGKRILFSGCSHKGILNIMQWFRPDILIGGFHFMNLQPGEELRSFAKMLDAYDTIYYTCHCTGTQQYEFMKPYMRNLHYLSEGQTIII